MFNCMKLAAEYEIESKPKNFFDDFEAALMNSIGFAISRNQRLLLSFLYFLYFSFLVTKIKI